MKSLRSILRRQVPTSALPTLAYLYRTYIRLLCWYHGLRDERNNKRRGLQGIPPAHLRYRVHGALDIQGFLYVGEQSSQSIRSALTRVGRELTPSQQILDFGCGCGRTLRYFARDGSQSHFYGTDIDIEAIGWCRQNLQFATFTSGGSVPPLEYGTEMFDIIWAISVFTHLNEEYQFCWLEELKRVSKPKGILLLTVHGESAWKRLPRREVAKIHEKGFLFIITQEFKGVFPEWYQAAYHTREYVFDRYVEYFDILEYIPCAVGGLQDLIVLQKPLP